MQNSFKVLNQNAYDRNFGGTIKGVADPYITGYQFIEFVTLPPALYSMINKNPNNIRGDHEISSLLAGSCLSVTPPGGTLNKAEFTGLGGVKYSVPTNIDYGNTLTIKFLEFSSLPILATFHGWVKMIRDYKNGTSKLVGDNYTKSQYAGTLLYWTTKPDGVTVEYSALYTGVFPTKDPQDLYSGDLSSVDKLEIDMEFNVDWTWHEDWVQREASVRAQRRHSAGMNYSNNARKEV